MSEQALLDYINQLQSQKSEFPATFGDPKQQIKMLEEMGWMGPQDKPGWFDNLHNAIRPFTETNKSGDLLPGLEGANKRPVSMRDYFATIDVVGEASKVVSMFTGVYVGMTSTKNAIKDSAKQRIASRQKYLDDMFLERTNVMYKSDKETTAEKFTKLGGLFNTYLGAGQAISKHLRDNPGTTPASDPVLSAMLKVYNGLDTAVSDCYKKIAVGP